MRRGVRVVLVDKIVETNAREAYTVYKYCGKRLQSIVRPDSESKAYFVIRLVGIVWAIKALARKLSMKQLGHTRNQLFVKE